MGEDQSVTVRIGWEEGSILDLLETRGFRV